MSDATGAWPPDLDPYRLAGYLPFTAFGQLGEGRLDLRVFGQDTWWVDVHGRPHRLDEMSANYRSNVIGFLLDTAEHHHRGMVALASVVVEAVVLHDLPAPRGWSLDAFDRYARLNPLDWIEDTPLLRRLRELTPEAPRRS